MKKDKIDRISPLEFTIKIPKALTEFLQKFLDQFFRESTCSMKNMANGTGSREEEREGKEQG